MALGADNSWVPIVVQAGVSLLLLLVFLFWLAVQNRRHPDGVASRFKTSESWRSTGTPEHVLTQTVEAARDHRATLVRKDEALAQMTIGSDSVFRVWGLLTPKLSCPMRFEISVTPKAGNETVVSVEVENAPGWYAFELKRLSKWKVHQAFRGLLAMLRGASGGVEVALDESVDLSLPTILDQITMFLGSAGETGPADTIRGLRERVDRGDPSALEALGATASSEGVLGRLVVESLNGKGITGREFSEANRRLSDLRGQVRRKLEEPDPT
jgi:hypothetical protein